MGDKNSILASFQYDREVMAALVHWADCMLDGADRDMANALLSGRLEYLLFNAKHLAVLRDENEDPANQGV